MPRLLLSTVLLAMALVLAISMAAPAAAFDRPFPSHVRRGVLNTPGYPEIVLNGKQRLLAPGIQIRNTQNLIELPTHLRGRDLAVNYTEDANGEIFRIWILTPEEIAREKNAPSPLPTPLPTPRPITTGPPSPNAGGQ